MVGVAARPWDACGNSIEVLYYFSEYVPTRRSMEQMDFHSIAAEDNLGTFTPGTPEPAGICCTVVARCAARGSPISSARAMQRRKISQSFLVWPFTNCLR